MRQFLYGALVAIVCGSLAGFIYQRAPGKSVTQTSESDSLATGRFVIYDPTGSLPMLLDSRTGRTWFRQYGGKDSLGNSTGLFWTPVKITPADTAKNWFTPSEADIAR